MTTETPGTTNANWDIEHGPVEVRLTKKNIKITCMVTRDDESTYWMDIDSLSMRGAQREATGIMIRDDYTPAGRWEDEETEVGAETYRNFTPTPRKPKPKAAELPDLDDDDTLV